jgi:hypothetical protein
MPPTSPQASSDFGACHRDSAIFGAIQSLLKQGLIRHTGLPRGSRLYLSKISFSFFAVRALSNSTGGSAALRYSTEESAVQLVFIIAIMFLGITTAQGQTMLQLNGPTNSSESAVGTDSLSAPTSSLPSMSPSPASQFGTASGSTTAAGSTSGATGASSASGNSQSPLLLPGEIPDTSTQAASTTATASGPSSSVCPPPVPSTDGGSANLSEIAGVSLGGC